jgi:O-antigen biosynthesis protein
VSRICVVIPMYGKAEYTRKCVDLVKKNYNTGEPIEIVVVDDGSAEPYVDPLVNVVRLEKNTGFTNAANEGILWAQYRNCDYVHLLNNDTEPKPDFLRLLLAVMESDETIGIAGSAREYHNGRIELCGADLIRGHQYFADANLPDDPMNVNWIPLCSALMRMDMIREIGLLDKRFRNHCSDSFYCIHAKMNGWKVILHPLSKVIHHLSVTTSEMGINPDNDQRLFIEKLAGMDYQKLMNEMPLDISNKSYGQIEFKVVTR